MMKKSGFRLIAWLLALVMIINIAPVTAFAGSTPSNHTETKILTITYQLINGGFNEIGGWQSSFTPEDGSVTPSFSDVNWGPQGKMLIGWSQDQNSTTPLFDAGEAVDVTKLTLGENETNITLYGVWGDAPASFTAVYVIQKELIIGGESDVELYRETVNDKTPAQIDGNYVNGLKNTIPDGNTILDGTAMRGRSWNSDTNTLTVYLKPASGIVEIHYMYVCVYIL